MTISTASLFALNGGSNTIGSTAEHKSGSRTGTVNDMVHGDGTFASTFEIVNGQKTVDKTVTFADGTQRTKERVITLNDDGSKTISKTGANGKTTTIQESAVKNDDGTTTISKEITNANGKVSELTGTVSKTDGETDKSFTRTNAKGQTETYTTQVVHDGNTTTHTKTGTGYNGNPIYNESTWTTFV